MILKRPHDGRVFEPGDSFTYFGQQWTVLDFDIEETEYGEIEVITIG